MASVNVIVEPEQTVYAPPTTGETVGNADIVTTLEAVPEHVPFV